MDKFSRYYLTAGVTAFLLYFCLICLFLLYLTSSKTHNFASFKKETILELDFVVLKSKENSSTNKTEVENKIVKQSTSSSLVKTTSLKSLFSKVKISSNKVYKDEVLNVKKNITLVDINQNSKEIKKAQT